MKPTQRTAESLADLGELVPDWLRHLKVANLSPSTISSYRSVAEELRAYLREQGMPTAAEVITREHVESYLVDLAERPNRRTGKPISPAHVAKRFRSLQQLFRWLDETEGEISTNPMAKMRPPQVPEQPVPVLTEEQLAALLATTKGSSFEHRRDAALLRFFIDTGTRIGEVASLTVDALDFDADVAHVFGKGRRARAVPFGVKTGEALCRYLRARAKHPYADRAALWLGKQGPLAEYGMRQVIRRRGRDAEIEDLHPHMFRHSFAHRWLAEGGQEQDLMRLAGWRSREMVGRYGASAADERAREAPARGARRPAVSLVARSRVVLSNVSVDRRSWSLRGSRTQIA